MPATEAHARELAPRVRAADAAEIWASNHARPLDALLASLVSRDTLAGLADGRVMCMFGAKRTTVLSTTASPWLLGANELPEHARAFLRMNREYIRHLQDEYDTLVNFVDARNVVALRWIQWLGFKIEPPVPYGPEMLPFCRFTMRGLRGVKVVVRKCTISEVESNENFPALAREYAAEAAIAGLPKPDEKAAAYRAIEQTGIFHSYGAFFGDLLVGFISVLLPVIPHYGVAIAVAESFFVGKKYRKTGAGLKLLHAVERHAREAKSPGLLVSAPWSGPLAEVLPRVGYRETNRVFFKEMAHA